MAASNQMDCNTQVPEVVVKNTFLDFDMSQSKSSLGYQSQSCPAEVFSPSQGQSIDSGQSLADSLAGISDMRMCDLAVAAQMFSNVKISRAEMESCGHVASRGSESSPVDTCAERTWGFDSFSSLDFQDDSSGIGGPAPQFQPPPPPLLAACFSEDVMPEAPNWSPKFEKIRNRPVPPPLSMLETSSDIPAVPAWTPTVGTDVLPTWTPVVETGDATPDAPSWTPKVGSVGTAVLHGPAPPPAPAPVMSRVIPFMQEQFSAYSFCNRDLSIAPPLPSAAPVPQVWWYRVSFLGGIALRSAPSIDAERTGHMLYQNETFAVSEHIQGVDGRVYLLLADFRGWAFDDSALMPHDPSVVRGRWSQMDGSQVDYYQAALPILVFEQSLAALGNEQSKRRRRRKRGGVKRNKNKRALAAAVLAKEEACEDVDTDAPSEDDEETPLEADSSSSNGAAAEGAEMLKEEDFPQLSSLLSR